MKKIWVTSLIKDEQAAAKVMQTAKQYGLEAGGSFWVDDNKNLAWSNIVEHLAGKDVGLWVIITDKKAINQESVATGVKLLTMKVDEVKGGDMKRLILTVGESPELSENYESATVLDIASPTLGAKLAAMANTPSRKINLDYRFTVHATPGVGLWLEVGPKDEVWEGVIFAVNGAKINFHGVAEAGKLPERATLEYQMKGIKLESGGKEYTAWGAQNKLDKDTSYYVRIDGDPRAVLFGEMPKEDSADLHSIKFM